MSAVSTPVLPPDVRCSRISSSCAAMCSPPGTMPVPAVASSPTLPAPLYLCRKSWNRRTRSPYGKRAPTGSISTTTVPTIRSRAGHGTRDIPTRWAISWELRRIAISRTERTVVASSRATPCHDTGITVPPTCSSLMDMLKPSIKATSTRVTSSFRMSAHSSGMAVPAPRTLKLR